MFSARVGLCVAALLLCLILVSSQGCQTVCQSCATPLGGGTCCFCIPVSPPDNPPPPPQNNPAPATPTSNQPSHNNYIAYTDSMAITGTWQIPTAASIALCADTTSQPGACRASHGETNYVQAAQARCDGDPACAGITCNGVNCDLRYYPLTIPVPGWANFRSYIKQSVNASFVLPLSGSTSPTQTYAAFENNYAITDNFNVPNASKSLCPDLTSAPGSCRAGNGVTAAQTYCNSDPLCVGITCSGNNCDARYHPMSPPVPGWTNFHSYVKTTALYLTSINITAAQQGALPNAPACVAGDYYAGKPVIDQATARGVCFQTCTNNNAIWNGNFAGSVCGCTCAATAAPPQTNPSTPASGGNGGADSDGNAGGQGGAGGLPQGPSTPTTSTPPGGVGPNPSPQQQQCLQNCAGAGSTCTGSCEFDDFACLNGCVQTSSTCVTKCNSATTTAIGMAVIITVVGALICMFAV